MNAAALAGWFCALATAVNLLSLAIAWARFRRAPAPLPAPAGAPPVSLVRPVCGIEAFSEETLGAGFRLDYPHYELIFCVQREDDPVLPLVRRLIAAHPHIPSRVLIGDDRVSDNPKLNNCVKGWDAAEHDWIVLADSNVLMPPDYIQRLQKSWRGKTGLVCATPIGSRPLSFWAEVECAFLNTLQARWQYVGESLGLGFAQGKSMLWRRDVLEERGGIRALGQEIAEDAAATKLVRRAGLNVHLADEPFEQPLGARGWREIWARQIRWARLRRVTFPLFFAPEILTGATLPLAAGVVWAVASGVSIAATLALLVVLWYGPEALLARRMGWHWSWRMFAAAPLRDLIIPVMWVRAWMADDVVWHGNAMTVRSKTDDPMRSAAS